MNRITIRIDEVLFVRAQELARSRGTTFNQLARDVVANEVNPAQGDWTKQMFEAADRICWTSVDGPMSRDESNLRGSGTN